MRMDIIKIEDFQYFSSEDYFAVKQCAYNFLENYHQGEMVAYAMNVLGYKGNEPEYKLFASTVLFPIDQEFCELYNQVGKILANFPKNYSEINSKSSIGQLYRNFSHHIMNILEIKAYEVDQFQLDLALEQGILNIPTKFVEENEEISRKTA